MSCISLSIATIATTGILAVATTAAPSPPQHHHHKHHKQARIDCVVQHCTKKQAHRFERWLRHLHSPQELSDAWWAREERRWGAEAAAREAVAAATQTPVVAEAASQPSSSPHVASGGGSSLEACIIQHESGGNPQATNGSHWGLGQWDQPTWTADGGKGSPSEASQGEQEAVLRAEGEAGQRQQQAQYDGC